MIKALILGHLTEAVRHAAPELNNLSVDDAALAGFKLERPKNAEHGDYAVNVSFLARATKMPPPAIAVCLATSLTQLLEKAGNPLSVQPMGGYLNFAVSELALLNALAGILQADAPGRNTSLDTERILLEYVSANPTGPLHIGHGRWAALGDSLVRILRHCGAEVTAEFYINDFGFQMEKMALSLWWRSVQCLQDDNKLLGGQGEADFVSQGIELIAQGTADLPYSGEFVIDLARELLGDPAYEKAIRDQWAMYALGFAGARAIHITDLPAWDSEIKIQLIDRAEPVIRGAQKDLLEKMHVHFDRWTSEKKEMHLSGRVAKTLEILEKTGHTYEEDGALWFRSEDFGDEKNRVLRKQDGSYTYLTADIAYHQEKFTRQGPTGKPYTRILNIWGADHHGYIARLRGSVEALGHDPNQFEVLLGQLVNLIVDGERTRMGKRRKMLTLKDVVDEVGVDATRFWMVSKSADSTLDFDVDLASSASSDNPVFYVQYAHARCCSIIRNATEPAMNVETGETQPAAVATADFERSISSLSAESMQILFSSLPAVSQDSRERAVLKTLIMRLDGFEEIVRDAARMRAPHFLTQYMMDLASQFHSFYNVCRIITPDVETTRSRLLLILALRKVLAQALELLGVDAPERM